MYKYKYYIYKIRESYIKLGEWTLIFSTLNFTVANLSGLTCESGQVCYCKIQVWKSVSTPPNFIQDSLHLPRMDLVPCTFIARALDRSSSNLTVAAEWKTTDTSASKVNLSDSLSPRPFTSMSPSTALNLSASLSDKSLNSSESVMALKRSWEVRPFLGRMSRKDTPNVGAGRD